MPSVLFLPDLYYDRRIWGDIPSSLGDAFDVVSFDAHESMPRTEAGIPAFLDAIRHLAPDPWRTIVVAAGLAAGPAVRAALSGLAGGLLLFQPAPDHIPPEAVTDVPVGELLQASAPYANILDASLETDATRRAEVVAETWRDIYGQSLTAPDLELASQVIADHVEELLADVKVAQAEIEAGGAPPLGLPWVDNLDELSVPVTVVSGRRGGRIGRAIAQRILKGQFVAADADTDLVWLEDRGAAVSVLRNLLSLLSLQESLEERLQQMSNVLIRSWAAIIGAIACIAGAVTFILVPGSAQAAGLQTHWASVRNVQATFFSNSWSTPKYGVSEFAENYVTVGSLGGACGAFCDWYQDLRAGDGQVLYSSAAQFSATTVGSPVVDWGGHVYSEIVVGPWTSASNITFETLTY